MSLSPPHVAKIGPNSAVHLSFKHIYFPLDITKIFLEAVMSLSTPDRLNHLLNITKTSFSTLFSAAAEFNRKEVGICAAWKLSLVIFIFQVDLA